MTLISKKKDYYIHAPTFCKMNVCWIGLAGAFVAFGCQIPNGAGNDAQKGCKSHQDSSRNHFSFVLDEKGDTHELLWLNKNFLRVQVKD